MNLKNFYAFIFGCAGSSLLHELFSVAVRRINSLIALCRLLIAMASHCRAQALGQAGFGICSPGF